MTFAQLQIGKWYAIGFEMYSMVDKPFVDYGPIYQYHGDKCFTDDDGNTVDYFYDPELQLPVAVDAADDYALQG